MAKKASKSQPILVPVDFSPHSEAALAHATRLAILMKVPLIVLHVVHDPGEAPGFYAGKRGKKGLAKLEDVAKEMMDDFIAGFCKRYPQWNNIRNAETRLSVGLPVTRILDAVMNSNAQIVIMGSQGRTGLSHILLGSKAEQIVRLCPVPVTIVKADAG